MSSADTSSQVPQEELTLTEFLLARIAEDEVVARDFAPEEVANPLGERQRYIHSINQWVTFYDPAGVLAGCQAKERRVVLLTEMESSPDNLMSSYAYSLLCMEAAAHSNHPDYRQEWRP